jgi:hypothetical protein
MKQRWIWVLGGLLFFVGCGYTTRSTLPSSLKTVHIEKFVNQVDFATERTRNLYFPLIEVDIRNAVSDRFLFDGNLRVSDSDLADLLLKGTLLSYDRDALRLTDSDDPQEYRVHVTVALELWDMNRQELVWREPNFTGEATYFVTGSQSRSEKDAVEDAITDLARRIVERTIENW